MPLVQMRIILAVCRLGSRFCWQLHFLSIRWRLGLELAGKIACQLPLLGQRCSLEFWAFSAEQKSVFGYIVGKNGIIAGSAERVCCCWQCCKQCNNICFTWNITWHKSKIEMGCNIQAAGKQKVFRCSSFSKMLPRHGRAAHICEANRTAQWKCNKNLRENRKNRNCLSNRKVVMRYKVSGAIAIP